MNTSSENEYMISNGDESLMKKTNDTNDKSEVSISSHAQMIEGTNFINKTSKISITDQNNITIVINDEADNNNQNITEHSHKVSLLEKINYLNGNSENPVV